MNVSTHVYISVPHPQDEAFPRFFLPLSRMESLVLTFVTNAPSQKGQTLLCFHILELFSVDVLKYDYFDKSSDRSNKLRMAMLRSYC